MQKSKPIFVLWEKFYIEEEHMNTKTNKEQVIGQMNVKTAS